MLSLNSVEHFPIKTVNSYRSTMMKTTKTQTRDLGGKNHLYRKFFYHYFMKSKFSLIYRCGCWHCSPLYLILLSMALLLLIVGAITAVVLVSKINKDTTIKTTNVSTVVSSTIVATTTSNNNTSSLQIRFILYSLHLFINSVFNFGH